MDRSRPFILVLGAALGLAQAAVAAPTAGLSGAAAVAAATALAASVGENGATKAKAVGEGGAVLYLDAAEAARRAGEWPEAARLYAALAADNPTQGGFFLELANARYQTGEWELSAEAYARAAELGFRKGAALYNRACCLSRLGRTEQAVTALEEAIRNGLQNREELLRTDTDLDSIRDTALFQERILPIAPSPGGDRVGGWRVDLDYLDKRVRETHWEPFRVLPEAEWRSELRSLSDDIPDLEDTAAAVRLMKLIARVGDGHTSVWPKNDGTWHAIPAVFYWFTDGLFLLAAAPEYEDAIGGRVTRIGGLSADEALRRAETVTPRDNEMTLRWLAPQVLSIMEVLKGLEIAESVDRLDLEIEQPGGERRTVHFESVPFHWMHGIPDGFVTMADEDSGPVPLWQRHPENPYWFESLPDEDLAYFQFNSVRDREDGPSIAEFTKTLFDSLIAEGTDALVIDVRRNNGGNNFLLSPLLEAIRATPALRERGHLFVIIGRGTFSACQNFVNRLDRDVHPIFVGEPTGSRPNFVGEDNPIILPWSGLTVSASSRYWQDALSEDARPWIAPELIAEMSSKDFRTNRDPAMETVRAYLATRRTATGRR